MIKRAALLSTALLLCGSLVIPSVVEAQQQTPIQTNSATAFPGVSNGQPVMLVPNSALIGGPVAPAFNVTGSITVTTVGSVTIAVMAIAPTVGASPQQIPIGSVVTGTGVTAGTVVTAAYGPSSYAVQAQGGTIAAVSNVALTITPKLATTVQTTIAQTAPAYSAGGCTVGPPAFSATSTIWNWTLTNGTGTCTLNTITFTFPAAPVSWTCTATSTLNPSTDFYVSTGAASTTAVVFTDYSATGVAQPTKVNDVIVGACLPR